MGAVNKRAKSGGEPGNESFQPDEVDYNDEFIENSSGKKAVPFIRTFSLKDKLLLRSLLASELCPQV